MLKREHWASKVAGVVATIAVVAVGGAPLHAAQTQDAVLEELKQIRMLLERLVGKVEGESAPGPAEKVVLSTVGRRGQGALDAPVTIVEFTDLECPFCRQFHATTFPRLKSTFIDSGKVRFVTRDFPLDSLHPHATQAARAAQCADDQGQFWAMRSAILGETKLSLETFQAIGIRLGLDSVKLSGCIADAARHAFSINEDIADGRGIGVSGTPTFVVGRIQNERLSGVKIVGAQPFEVFERAVLSQLGQ